MPHRVTLIPGDGIGPEVSAACTLVLDAADVGIEWVLHLAGAGALEAEGALLPDATLESIKATRVALKGPITTPVGSGFRSVNVALRQELDLFAAVRPARALPGIPVAARRRRPGGDPREHRGPVSGHRVRARERGRRGPAARARASSQPVRARGRRHHRQADLRRRHAAHRVLRVRLRAVERAAHHHGRPQGERDALLGRPLPRDRRRGGRQPLRRGVPRDAHRPAVDAARTRAPGVRRPAAAEPVRRHPQRPVRGSRGWARADPGRQHRVGVRRVRARARQRTRHRGPGTREPDRDDPVGRDDAAARRRDARGLGRRARRRHRPRPRAPCAPATSAARPPRWRWARRSRTRSRTAERGASPARGRVGHCGHVRRPRRLPADAPAPLGIPVHGGGRTPHRARRDLRLGDRGIPGRRIPRLGGEGDRRTRGQGRARTRDLHARRDRRDAADPPRSVRGARSRCS